MGTWVSGSERAKGISSLVLLLFLAGCGDPAPVVTQNEPLVLYQFGDDFGVDAIANTGTLVIAGSCLALDDEVDGRVTIAWPEGRTSWSAATKTVRIDYPFDREPFIASLGDEIGLSGGRTTSGIDWVVRPADDCPTTYLVTG